MRRMKTLVGLVLVLASVWGCGRDGAASGSPDLPDAAGDLPQADQAGDGAGDRAGPEEADAAADAADRLPDAAEDAVADGPSDRAGDEVSPDAAEVLPELPDASELAVDVIPDLPAPEDVQVVDVPAPLPDPAQWGPYQVGTRSYQWFDFERMRLVPTTVWYPAIPGGQPKAKYLLIIEGNAYSNAVADTSGAPYPLMMFSHGFRGTAVQSVTFTEFIASHGYVVAAMDHTGNTLTDFFSNDETVAQVALERPRDVYFAWQQVCAESASATGPLSGMVDPARVAMSGHSFGGWTALVVAGGEMDVSGAQAACAAGSPSDIFCDYVGYWPAGQTVKMDPPLPGLKASIALAPGGYSAFGDAGLAAVDVPVMLFGGTLDPTCPVAVETDPIYNALPPPKYEVVITDASHMSFTNVCDLPLAQQFLADYCGVEGMLSPEEAFKVTNALAVSFLNYYVRDKAGAKQYLTQAYIDQAFGDAQMKSDPVN